METDRQATRDRNYDGLRSGSFVSMVAFMGTRTDAEDNAMRKLTLSSPFRLRQKFGSTRSKRAALITPMIGRSDEDRSDAGSDSAACSSSTTAPPLKVKVIGRIFAPHAVGEIVSRRTRAGGKRPSSSVSKVSRREFGRGAGA